MKIENVTLTMSGVLDLNQDIFNGSSYRRQNNLLWQISCPCLQFNLPFVFNTLRDSPFTVEETHDWRKYDGVLVSLVYAPPPLMLLGFCERIVLRSLRVSFPVSLCVWGLDLDIPVSVWSVGWLPRWIIILRDSSESSQFHRPESSPEWSFDVEGK